MITERTAPEITDRTAAFWTGGANGELLIAHCQTCGLWLHPPRPVCRRCRGRDIRPEPVSGLGTVWSYTVSRYQWSPALEPPYVIAEVELEEQPGLRLLTTVVDCDEITIGLPVRARFELAGEAWIPVFAPVGSS
jgi:uncharacterized OB-fold protein